MRNILASQDLTLTKCVRLFKHPENFVQLIEIEEPIVKARKREIGIGIDFGTTNSLVAFSKNHKPYVIEMIPSIVGTDENGVLQVMDEGMRSIKRRFSSLQGESKSSDEAIRISSVIISYLKSSAEKHLGTDVTKAVITV